MELVSKAELDEAHRGVLLAEAEVTTTGANDVQGVQKTLPTGIVGYE